MNYCNRDFINLFILEIQFFTNFLVSYINIEMPLSLAQCRR